MKTLVRVVPFLLLCASGFAQQVLTSKPGLSGIISNPAFISSSNAKAEIQLFSAGASFSGNQPYFNVAHLNRHSFSDAVFQSTGLVSGSGSVDVTGPSVLFTARKTSFAFFTRARAMANVTDFDGGLLHSLNDQYFNSHPLPYTLSSNRNMRGSLSAWTELGFSFSRTLFSNEQHSLKGGISLRLLSGLAGADIQLGQLNGTVNYNRSMKEYVISQATGDISMALSSMRISGLHLNDVLVEGGKALESMRVTGNGQSAFPGFKNLGAGVDVGLCYEFKQAPDDENYKLRLGIAVNDLGGIRFKKDIQQSGSYAINIDPSNPLKLKDLYNLDLPRAKQLLANHPESFIPAVDNQKNAFYTQLLTSIQTDIDYQVANRWYIAASSRLDVSGAGWSYVSLIPRYETAKFTAALPISYDWLSQTRAGVYVSYGVVSLGSNGLFTSIVQPSRHLDAYCAIRFQIGKKQTL
jgi:hypothetical protein